LLSTYLRGIVNAVTFTKRGGILNDWLDREEYPFSPKTFNSSAGTVSYLDEGKGTPILLLHGNPAWSFLYRKSIPVLSKEYRCIAPDLLGFGLSDKPEEWSYLPSDHAKIISELIEHLKLKGIVIALNDWGGPIGMSYAVNNPDNVRAFVIQNTWAWSVKGNPHFERFSAVMGGFIGRFLITRYNFFVKVVMKMGFGEKRKLTKQIHRQYIMPQNGNRKGCIVFPKEIIGSSAWLESIWEKIPAVKGKPALILWGKKDIAFGKNELVRWQNLFERSTTVQFQEVGHYVQEELGAEFGERAAEFLKKSLI